MKNLNKNLIVKIVLIVAFIALIGINTSVLAASNTAGGFQNLTLNSNTSNVNSSSGTIEVVNTANNTTTNSANNIANNTTKPGDLANTGLEDLPWLVIAVCGISAVFAYNKIKEYKSI